MGAEPAEFSAGASEGAAGGEEEREEGGDLGSAEEEVRGETGHGGVVR